MDGSKGQRTGSSISHDHSVGHGPSAQVDTVPFGGGHSPGGGGHEDGSKREGCVMGRNGRWLKDETTCVCLPACLAVCLW